MNDKEIEALKLHVAGATVIHKSPFDELKTYKNDFKLDQAYLDKWIIPFYMNIGHAYGHTYKEWIEKLKTLKHEITEEVIYKALGDFNWRTRQTGAFFAAILNQKQFIDIIGIHLLKSEVCYAGGAYCKVLISFNTPKCVDYLNLYLDYYLTKPELWFDQRDAMEAICYLDKLNGTNNLKRHLKPWEEFIKNKSNWQLEITTENTENQLSVINSLKA